VTEMEERVARAMAAKTRPARAVGEDDWEAYIPLVRVAFTELREPTEAMLIAARDWSYAKYGKPIGNDAAIGCWQAMLDAALEPPGETP
jgi:hypothetical protein